MSLILAPYIIKSHKVVGLMICFQRCYNLLSSGYLNMNKNWLAMMKMLFPATYIYAVSVLATVYVDEVG